MLGTSTLVPKKPLSFPHLVFQTAANGSHMFQTWIDVSSLIQSYSRAKAGLQLWNLWTSSKPWPKGPDSTMVLQTACHAHKAAGGHKSWGKKTCHQCCTIFFYFGHRPFRNASVWTSNGLNLLELHAVSLLQVFISAKCKWDKPGKNDVRFQHATGKTQQ